MCVPREECKNGLFRAPDGVGCVETCPDPYFEEVDKEKECRSGCSGLFVIGKALTECVSECPNTLPYHENEGHCVASCPEASDKTGKCALCSELD